MLGGRFLRDEVLNDGDRGDVVAAKLRLALRVLAHEKGAEKDVLKDQKVLVARVDPLGHLGQAFADPAMHFTLTEIPLQRQCVHWPGKIELANQ